MTVTVRMDIPGIGTATIECESVDDAIAIIRALANNGKRPSAAKEGSPHPRSPRKSSNAPPDDDVVSATPRAPSWTSRIACLMSAEGSPKQFRAVDVVTALVASGMEEDGSVLRGRISVALSNETHVTEPAWTRAEPGLYQLTRRGKTMATAGGGE